jgi:hypothetical protein
MAANNLLALALAFVMQIARRKITSSTMRVLFFLPPS